MSQSNGPLLSGAWVTLVEATAWIMTRDEKFASECREMNAVQLSLQLAKWKLNHGGPPRQFWLDAKQADRELLNVLRHGLIDAIGERTAGRTAPLAASDWSKIRFSENHDTKQKVAVATWGGPPVVQAIFISTGRLIELFPETHSNNQERDKLILEAAKLRFDPMKEVHWSVPMILVWILSRSPDAIREHWEEYRLNTPVEWPSYWLDVKRYSEKLTEAERYVPSLETAWNDLRLQAQAGIIIAHGFDSSTKNLCSIAPLEWREMGHHTAARDGFLCRPKHREGGYFSVTFPAKDIRDIWPGVSVQRNNSDAPKPARGRRKTYDWEKFEAEAYQQLDYEGGLSGTINYIQSDLEAAMAKWCDDHWERSPSESSIRQHVSDVRKRFEANKGR